MLAKRFVLIFNGKVKLECFFIQYRIGGGIATNLGVNVINQIGAVDFSIVGPSDIINNQVINSLTVVIKGWTNCGISPETSPNDCRFVDSNQSIYI